MAAVREVAEETGLIVELTSVLGAFGGRPEFRVTYTNGDVVDYVMVVYGARVTGGALAPSEELPELRWVARDELAAVPLAPWARLVVPAVLDGRLELP
jgi:8-oxo-dGTP pyrophosphatase MutT (NUDIX family)